MSAWTSCLGERDIGWYESSFHLRYDVVEPLRPAADGRRRGSSKDHLMRPAAVGVRLDGDLRHRVAARFGRADQQRVKVIRGGQAVDLQAHIQKWSMVV